MILQIMKMPIGKNIKKNMKLSMFQFMKKNILMKKVMEKDMIYLTGDKLNK